jgi:ADP-heptose:LPS heptosyltransferase
MHIAAALGTPVVSLWGATDPVRTGPYAFGDLVIQGAADCSPCRRKHCAIDRVCMQSIGNDTILSMIDRALAHRAIIRSVPGEASVSLS